MSWQRLTGHVLLWIGFLAGAFLAVCRTEVAEAPWATISWPAYMVALGIAIAGVMTLRMSNRMVAGQTDKHTGAVQRMSEILGQLQHTVADLRQRRHEVPVHDFHVIIDRDISDALAEFAEIRESLIAAFSLEVYADVMTEFALAERIINRTWSASADGYVDEVHSCLERAERHLQQAALRLETARQK